jgi:hypothetical protein
VLVKLARTERCTGSTRSYETPDHRAGLDESTVGVAGDGVEAAPSAAVQSPETYVGYRRGERFASPERLARGVPNAYHVPDRLVRNDWGLIGSWNVGPESALLEAAGGRIVFRFHSRDLHLVLAPRKDGRPVRFKVTLDGAAPGDAHGSDSAPDGSGEVREPRLYQLIRQGTHVDDRTLEIQFLDCRREGVRVHVRLARSYQRSTRNARSVFHRLGSPTDSPNGKASASSCPRFRSHRPSACCRAPSEEAALEQVLLASPSGRRDL